MLINEFMTHRKYKFAPTGPDDDKQTSAILVTYYAMGRFLKMKHSWLSKKELQILQNEPRGSPSSLQGFESEFASMLNRSGLALVELQGPNDCSYAIGPFHSEEGIRLLPLVNLGFSAWRKGNPRAVGRKDGTALVNLLAVKLNSEAQLSGSSSSSHVSRKLIKSPLPQKSKDADPVPPARATYAGPCLAAILSWSALIDEYTDTKADSYYNQHFDIRSVAIKNIHAAEDEGRPPPYKIDIE